MVEHAGKRELRGAVSSRSVGRFPILRFDLSPFLVPRGCGLTVLVAALPGERTTEKCRIRADISPRRASVLAGSHLQQPVTVPLRDLTVSRSIAADCGVLRDHRHHSPAY